MKASDLIYPTPTQLDRIEEKLDLLLAKKKPVKPRASKKHNYPPEFEKIWLDYPECTGANKAKTYAAYKKRISEGLVGGNVPLAIHMGVLRYAELCEATGRWVMLPATFMGPDKHYENNWTLPAEKRGKDLPRNDADLEAFAVDNNLHGPGAAPQNIQNMGQYRKWIQERIVASSCA